MSYAIWNDAPWVRMLPRRARDKCSDSTLCAMRLGLLRDDRMPVEVGGILEEFIFVETKAKEKV